MSPLVTQVTEVEQTDPCGNNEQIENAFGCVFCMTGQEDLIAKRMSKVSSVTYAYPVIQVKHKSVSGEKLHCYERVFPGYVFFKADNELDLLTLMLVPGVLRVLKDHDNNWALSGSDREFVRWIIHHNGLINVSQAHREGDKVVFHDGLLKDYESSVIKVDKHRGNALVALRFIEIVFRVWMAFDWID